MIRGKKNYIHPSKLEMGATILYKIDNESMVRHLNDRKTRQVFAKD